MFGETKYPNKKERLIYKRQAKEAYYHKTDSHVRDYNQVKANVLHWDKEDKRYARVVSEQKAEAGAEKPVEQPRPRRDPRLLEEPEPEVQKVSPQERLRQLEEEARKLEEDNIKRKQQFVEEARQKRLIQSSDELRQHKSKLLMNYCTMQRNQMTEQKRLEKIRAEKEKQNFADTWLAEAREKEAREERERKEKRERAAQFYREVDAQNKSRVDEKARRDQEKAAEIQAMFEKLQKEYAEIEAEKIRKAEEKAEARKQAIADVKASEMRKEQRRQNKLQEDKEWVAEVIEREKEKESNEHELKELFRKDQEAYIAYNRHLKNLEEENERLLNEHSLREQEKTWLKREEAWNREKAARDLLHRQVELERIQQRKDKMHRKLMEKEENAAFHRKLMKQVAELDFEEQKKQQEFARRKAQMKEEILRELAERQVELKRRKEEDIGNVRTAEADYQKMIEEQKRIMEEMAEESPETFFRHEKKTANWFTT